MSWRGTLCLQCTTIWMVNNDYCLLFVIPHVLVYCLHVFLIPCSFFSKALFNIENLLTREF